MIFQWKTVSEKSNFLFFIEFYWVNFTSIVKWERNGLFVIGLNISLYWAKLKHLSFRQFDTPLNCVYFSEYLIICILAQTLTLSFETSILELPQCNAIHVFHYMYSSSDPHSLPWEKHSWAPTMQCNCMGIAWFCVDYEKCNPSHRKEWWHQVL